ncbi:MAG: HTH domain-containing protein [Armatimonadota bacterium]
MNIQKMTFIQIAEKVLSEEKIAMSPEEIWEMAKTKGYDQLVGTQGKTPWRSIGAQLYVDVRDNQNSKFSATDTRPKRFHIRTINPDIQDIPYTNTKQIKKTQYLEKNLHPFLVYYGFHYLKAYVKTINAQKSEKKEFGEWVHPDIVGCYFSFQEWKEEVVGVSSYLGQSAIRLFSFELKRELNFSNLREAFFQAVSNSSWANEGYLVAADIESNDDFMIELKRLSASFGIGIIKLDIEDPDSTEIILPARSKDSVDWETVNKLTINPDFSKFLKRVKNDISTREVRKEEYDMVRSKEDLIANMQEIYSK